MINISKRIEAHLLQALARAFNKGLQFGVSFQNGTYESDIAEQYSTQYKKENLQYWKETLYPKDVASEILIHFQPILIQNIKLITNIEVNSSGTLIFHISDEYRRFAHQLLTGDDSPKLELIFQRSPITVLGPFYYGLQDPTFSRGIAVARQLALVLNHLGAKVRHHPVWLREPAPNIPNQVRARDVSGFNSLVDYLVVPAQFMETHNPRSFGYNYSSLSDPPTFLAQDPWVPQHNLPELAPFRCSVDDLVLHYPSILERCLERKSFVELERFKLTFVIKLMKKALQILEKSSRLTYHSTISNLNYRMQVQNQQRVLGTMHLHLNQSNLMINAMIQDILHKKQFELIKEQARMVFVGNFEAFINLAEVTTYYPDTGLLVYNVEEKKLILHLQREAVAQRGIVIGNIMGMQATTILQDLRDLNACVVKSENSRNFFLRRTLNISLAVSLLILANSLTFKSENQVGLFVRDERDFKEVFAKRR